MDSREFIRKMIDTIGDDQLNPSTDRQPLAEAQISINLEGPDAEEFLSRLLNLSGQSMQVMQQPDIATPALPAPIDTPSVDDPVITSTDSDYVCDDCHQTLETCGCVAQEGAMCEQCGLPEGTCECDMSISTHGPLSNMSETADHDYGLKDDDDGEIVDQKTYIYRPEQVPQRLSKPGDNPMVAEEVMSRYKKLVNEYVSFMAESSIPNEDGIESPLTAADREEFDKDPSANEELKTDGSMSPMSTIKRQDVMK
jgi:hypothetical protein